MKTGRATPTDGSIESTVFADVETLEVNDASVRVYDCAGQVCYGCGAMRFELCLLTFSRIAVCRNLHAVTSAAESALGRLLAADFL